MSGFALAIAAVVSAVAYSGATVYSAAKESSAAKKAAEAQKELGLKQLEAAKESETLSAQTARDKLRAKQAGRTQSILTPPGGLLGAGDTNLPGILGV